MKSINLVAGAVMAVLIGAGIWWFSQPTDQAEIVADDAQIVIPELSPVAQSGEVAFNDNCSACHGINAAGTDQGPSFISRIYVSSHHGDAAFLRAAKLGVQPHHWRFGPMPVISGVSEAEVRWITKYIRELQAANGIN